MSKNKNPLKDLDQFLKQQPSSLINPPSLGDKIQPEETTPATILPTEITSGQLIQKLEELAKNDKKAFYDILIQVGEKLQHADEKMLINTALYLKGGDQWKELVKAYWGKRPVNH